MPAAPFFALLMSTVMVDGKSTILDQKRARLALAESAKIMTKLTRPLLILLAASGARSPQPAQAVTQSATGQGERGQAAHA